MFQNEVVCPDTKTCHQDLTLHLIFLSSVLCYHYPKGLTLVFIPQESHSLPLFVADSSLSYLVPDGGFQRRLKHCIN